MTSTVYYQSPIGILSLTESDGFISSLSLVSSDIILMEPQTPLLKEACKQLSDYFAGIRFSFNLPLKQVGSPFEQKVWYILSQIPYGETISYQQLAACIGNPKSSRAVGNANAKNNIPIIVPCHRVVKSDHTLGGYIYGADVKQYLIDLEISRKK